MNNKTNDILYSLSKSKFRSSFYLKKYMINYINDKGMNKVKEHAYIFVNQKLMPAYPKNDGRQTPTKNHPVFIAMHACGCCCRSCLEKWHHIPKGRCLTNDEIDYIVNLLMVWIKNEYCKNLFIIICVHVILLVKY